MRENNRQYPVQRHPYRFKQGDPFLNTIAPFRHLFRNQASRFMKKLSTSFEFAHIVEEGCGTEVVDMVFVESHAMGYARSVKSYPVGVIVSVFVIRNELLQNCQEAEIGV